MLYSATTIAAIKRTANSIPPSGNNRNNSIICNTQHQTFLFEPLLGMYAFRSNNANGETVAWYVGIQIQFYQLC